MLLIYINWFCNNLHFDGFEGGLYTKFNPWFSILPKIGN
jgi:hypothetical protein